MAQSLLMTACAYLILPYSDRASFQAFLDVLARRFAREEILLVLERAPSRCCGLAVADNIASCVFRPFAGTQSERSERKSLESNPPEGPQNYAPKYGRGAPKLEQAVAYIDRIPSSSAPSPSSSVSLTPSPGEIGDKAR